MKIDNVQETPRQRCRFVGDAIPVICVLVQADHEIIPSRVHQKLIVSIMVSHASASPTGGPWPHSVSPYASMLDTTCEMFTMCTSTLSSADLTCLFLNIYIGWQPIALIKERNAVGPGRTQSPGCWLNESQASPESEFVT